MNFGNQARLSAETWPISKKVAKGRGGAGKQMHSVVYWLNIDVYIETHFLSLCQRKEYMQTSG